METLNSIFTWVGIIAAFLSAFAFLGTWWTGTKIDHSKRIQIEKLQQTVANFTPSIFSQTQESLNTQENKLFRQTYSVSINSPSPSMVIFTELKSRANRVGNLKTIPTNIRGTRKQGETYISYQDYLLTFLTDAPINTSTDKISFSTKQTSNLPVMDH